MVDPKETPSVTPLEELSSLDEAAVKKEGKAPEAKVEEAGDKKVEEDAKKTLKYSEDELSKRLAGLQSEKDSKIKGLEDKLQKTQEEADQRAAKTFENDLASWLKSVEAEGGDLKAAEAVAQAKREVEKERRDNQTKMEELTKRESEVQAGLKVLTAYDLVKEYELGQDTIEELLKAETPEAMEKVALKMKLEEVKAGKTPATKIDPGAATPKGVDFSQMPLEQRLGWAMEQTEEKGRKI